MKKRAWFFWMMAMIFYFSSQVSAGELAFDWWVTSKGTIDYPNGIINFNLAYPDSTQAIGRQNFSMYKGRTYVLDFEAVASKDMRLEIFFRQEGGDWSPYSAKHFATLKNQPIRYTFYIVSSYDDPKATLLINTGLDSGSFTMKNITLTDSGCPPVPVYPLNKNWWSTSDGFIDYGAGTISFEILAQPVKPYSQAFGQNFFQAGSGKLYRIKFRGIACQNTTILAKIRLNHDPWSVYGDKYFELRKGDYRYEIVVFSNTTDHNAVLVFECGYVTGKFQIKDLEIKEEEAKRIFLPLIIK